MTRFVSPFLLALALVTLCATTAVAQLQPGTPMTELTLDRADQNAVWRLSSTVTIDGRAPAAPRGVYVQFGFMGCAPCERLATMATEIFGDRVALIYVHLDDVLAGAMAPRDIWTRLYEVTRTGAYEAFVPIRRGSSTMMREMCGANANPPSGLLISPDGTLHSVLLSPSEDDARAALQAFASTL